uniref:C2H2-type domain-containing protein n=1 Tax=Elaeophora elaphi TaxID=1147741 RepID=A0A0R3RY47_9BILA
MAAHPVGVSPFPQPPEYARQYTDANVAKKNVLPPPAIPSEFTVFGEEYNFEEEMIRSLQSQKMQQLFSSNGDWRSELKKLNRSTVAAFLDLLDILIRCPNHPERLEKINNLRLLFINMHHLINEYRPVQARDALQSMMKLLIKTIEEVTSRFRTYLAMGQEALNQVIDEVPPVLSASPMLNAEDMNVGESVEQRVGAMESAVSRRRSSYDEARKTTASRREAWRRDIMLCELLDNMSDTDLERRQSPSTKETDYVVGSIIMEKRKMPKSSRQCESVHFPARNSRHPLLCAECHERFQTVQELYLHSEVCIIESFENEAISVFSSMPSLIEPTAVFVPVTHAGITAKVCLFIKSFKKGEDFPEQKLRGDDPPVLMPETDASVSSSRSTNLSLSAKCKAECSQVKTTEITTATETSKTTPISFMSTSESEQRYWSSVERSHKVPFELENAQVLQSPGGLKVYISIERQCGASNGNDGRDYESQACSSNGTNSKRKVIGALANANDDDTYRPKMECPTCGLVLYRHNFGTHYRIHTGELPFVCTYCQKRFRTTSALKVHIRAHTGEKPYSCPKCSYCCITKRNLDRHIINNHVREGERRGPRERRSRYRRDEYSVTIDDIEMTPIEEGEKIDHHYVISPAEIESGSMVKEKANDEMEGSDDNRRSVDMPVLPLLTL